MSEQNEEITLGTGRLLGLFFGLVVICALFFGLGFSLGRRSLPEPVAAATTTTPAIVSTGAKPSPGRAESAVKAEPQEGAAKSSSDELTFYKAVEQNEPKAKLDKPGSEHDSVAPEMARPAALTAGYMVQVAAVSKQEDADALVNALRRKSYPVISTNSPADKLYHIQVGPFPDLKDAEATRAKLIGDGYNPMLKK
jgi:cell division septation protein DedD